MRVSRKEMTVPFHQGSHFVGVKVRVNNYVDVCTEVEYRIEFESFVSGPTGKSPYVSGEDAYGGFGLIM